MNKEIKQYLFDNGFSKWVGKDVYQKDFECGNVQISDEGFWLGGYDACIMGHGFLLRYETIVDIEEIMNILNKFAIR